MVFLLPAPVAGAMWVDAFHPTLAIAATGVLTVTLALAAMVLSILAFTREFGPEYEKGGSRVGLLVVIVAILGYIWGTAAGSDGIHLLSIAAFYLGAVLYLGGSRSLLCAAPTGVILLSLTTPAVYGTWGMVYLDGLSWGIAVGSAGYLLLRRNTVGLAGCWFCDRSRSQGREFCSSCGGLIGRGSFPIPRRKIVRFAILSALLLLALSITVPLAYTGPTTSLVSFGLGGPLANQRFAPLQGWAAAPLTPKNGSAVSGYTLSQGRTSIQAFVATAQAGYIALSAVDSVKGTTTPYAGIPASIAGSMDGYTFKQGSTTYVGIQGVFPVETPVGSGVSASFVAVDLRQPLSAFQSDRGSALFAAATSVIGWSSPSGLWSPVLGDLLWAYQMLTQSAYLCSFSIVGVALFTVARDDELRRSRRNESARGLADHEAAALSVIIAGPRVATGEQLREAVRAAHPHLSDSEFYESLDELSRKDLVAPSVTLRGGVPKLHWRRTI